ncbi:transporter substrate-binding domain-containing protein [Larsenimonas rhizosphaerae]|uniref:transporter substrate-binding domain-containing protein n=1 Tax=Larsenimonas rhizosphaerae TaxID=2944682 RepID=UPI002034190B|nr:transporter substrate-binding domain-containing protein [Larsenimonas rhizosphaerae]MCM2130094.1 transporter substrate-binding domain-containing protein [Larsenimonas rhizosphaerae]
MKKWIAASLIASVMASGTALARIPDPVRIAIDVPYEPFVERAPDGSLKGFEIDLGNELCKRASLNCTWVEQGWDGLIPGLLARKYDAILSSMGITPERERQVMFSIPYYNTPSVFLTSRDRDINFDDKASLKGLTIGVQRGTIRDVYLSGQYADTFNIRRYGSSEDADNDLKAGRLDLIMEDLGVATSTLDFKTQDSPFKQIGPTLSTPTSIFGKGSGIAFRKRDQDLADRFNQAIRDVYADGTYYTLMDKYFDYDLSTPPDGMSRPDK